MRPIDANAFKEYLCAMCQAINPNMRDCTGKNCLSLKLVDDMPTLDVVSVVKCKDCLFSEEKHLLGDTDLYCKNYCVFIKESDYCSIAKRKDGEQK